MEFINTLTASSHLPIKFGTVYTLVYRCLQIFSSWTELHTELVCLKEIFLKNGYLEHIKIKSFKNFQDNIHVLK